MSASCIGRHGQIRRRNGRGPARGEEWKFTTPSSTVSWGRRRRRWPRLALLAMGCLSILLVAQRLAIDPGLVARLWCWGISNRRSPSQPGAAFDHTWLSRFRLWPLDMRPNDKCLVPACVLQKLAWDDAGRSYAILDRYRVLFSHLRPVPGMRLYFWTGTEVLSRHVELGLPVQPARPGYEGPFVAQLQEPLPADFLYLPVLPEKSAHHLAGKSILVFGRDGLLGVQPFASIGPCRDFPGQWFLYTRPQPQLSTCLSLNVGDSGCAALVLDNGHYYSAGSAHSLLGRSTASNTPEALTAFCFLPWYAASLTAMGVTLTWPEHTETPSPGPHALPVPAATRFSPNRRTTSP